ncbi:MAG: hypothetical protein JO337_05275 [Acidimicrobiales bacterium]|nr:hypothetical protein [Acidimicrobiales bacterium]
MAWWPRAYPGHWKLNPGAEWLDNQARAAAHPYPLSLAATVAAGAGGAGGAGGAAVGTGAGLAGGLAWTVVLVLVVLVLVVVVGASVDGGAALDAAEAVDTSSVEEWAAAALGMRAPALTTRITIRTRASRTCFAKGMVQESAGARRIFPAWETGSSGLRANRS